MGPKTSTQTKTCQIGWLICTAASLFYFYEFTQIAVLNSLSEQIMLRFSITATQLSNLSASYYYTNVIFLIPAGLILDKYSTKTSILSTMAISIVGTFIFATASSIGIAEVGRAISGIGGAFAFIGNIRLITRWLPPKKIALGISLLVTIGFIGGIVAQIPFSILRNHVGYSNSLFILITFGVFSWCIIALIVKDKKEKASVNSYKSSLGSLLKITITNPQTWLCGWYISLMNLPIIILAGLWSNLYLEDGDKLSSLEASSITSLLFIGITVGSPIAGWLSEKIKRKKPLMVFSAILSAVSLLGLFMSNITVLEISLLFFLIGFFSSSQCLGYPAIIENNPAKASAIASSLGSIIVLGGGALLKLFFGAILDFFWSGKIQDTVRVYSKEDFNAAFYLLIASFFIALVMTFFIKEK